MCNRQWIVTPDMIAAGQIVLGGWVPPSISASMVTRIWQAMMAAWILAGRHEQGGAQH